MTHAGDDMAGRRRALFGLAEQLGSVAAACRQLGVSRQLYYRWKRRHEQEGEPGLHDRAPGPAPGTVGTPAAVGEAVLALSAADPHLSCLGLVRRLADQGLRVSHTTVQRILHEAGRGLEAERLALAGLVAPEPRARSLAIPDRPGRVLAQWTLDVGHLAGQGDLRAYLAVDVATGRAFGRAAIEAGRREGEPAVALLEEVVLPHYAAQGLAVELIWTTRRADYLRRGGGAYLACLAAHGIAHEAFDARTLQSAASVERVSAAARTGLAAGPGSRAWLEAYNQGLP